MSRFRIIGLDTDGGLRHKPNLRRSCDGVIDLVGESDRLRLFCGARSASRARAKIQEARRAWPGPWLTVSGSGDFHHLSLMLLESLPAAAAPFSLVLIDNHPDWSMLPPRYHCGNWVAGALKLAGLKDATLIGQNSNDFRAVDMALSPMPDLASGRVRLIPWSLADVFSPCRWPRGAGRPGSPVELRALGSRVRFSPIAATGVLSAFEQAADRLDGQSIYMSIDKDSLDPKDAVTDWEQGRLRLDELVQGVTLLASRCHIIGADICGDRAPTPLRGRIKRLDAARSDDSHSPNPHEHSLNEAATFCLLDAMGAQTRCPAGAGT
jgi:hypothetical protein